MYPSVIKVSAGENHTVELEFSNGEQGTLDMTPFLDFGIFSKLKERQFFQQVRVSFDTIAWGEDIDLDPEFVYDKCQIREVSVLS